MSKIEIIGIRKPLGTYNHHSAISHYQWRYMNGHVDISDRMTVVNWILQNVRENIAYVTDRRGDVVTCKVMQNQFGTRFLETRPDGTTADNLLNLPRI